jgi:hypothetical protein
MMDNISETSYSQPITFGGLLVLIGFVQIMALSSFATGIRSGSPHYNIVTTTPWYGSGDSGRTLSSIAAEAGYDMSLPFVTRAEADTLERNHFLRLLAGIGIAVLATIGIAAVMRHYGCYWPASISGAALVPGIVIIRILAWF